MSRVSKAIGSFIGVLVSIVFAWLAIHQVGDGYTVWGFDQETVTTILTLLLTPLTTYLSPPNTPPRE